MTDPRNFLCSLFDAAVAAADPLLCLPSYLPSHKGRTIVIGAGKAAARMALAVERHWHGPLEGLVVTPYGHDEPCRIIEVVQASHPVPDSAGRIAAERIWDKVQGLTADDLLLCLISGGGSALLALPAPGITLDDKRAVTSALLKSGAAIGEINAVRKHLSAIKGGRLAAAAFPARIVTLAISDVPGDDPAVIASGPTVADPSTIAEALAVLQKYGITPPFAVAEHLCRGEDETPKPGDPRLAGAEFHIIASAQTALQAAAAAARKAGVTPLVLGDAIEGESREVAKVMAAIALQIKRHGQPAPAPCVLISGGETTVTVRGKGRGGRNSEFALALTAALDGLGGLEGIWTLAGDTDGLDGSGDNAGVIAGPDSLRRAEQAGINPRAALAGNDAYGLFAALNDLIVTGPTRTNVNDFRAIFIA